jgi:hypothetical protein
MKTSRNRAVLSEINVTFCRHAGAARDFYGDRPVAAAGVDVNLPKAKGKDLRLTKGYLVIKK